MKKTYFICKMISIMLVFTVFTGVFSGCSIFPSYSQDESKYADKNFANMKYVHLEIDEYNEIAQSVIDMSSNLFKSGDVVDGYATLFEIYTEALSMYTVAYINNSINVNDEYYSDELAYSTELVNDMDNTLRDVTEVLSKSNCRYVIETYMGDYVWDYYMPEDNTDDYENISELLNEEQELINEYNIASIVNYTTVYNGEELNIDGVYDLMYEIGADKANGLLKDIYHNKNAVLGEIYVKLVNVRKDIAKAYGYDSYADYMYEEYSRDYTPEESSEFYSAVKEYIVPVYESVCENINYENVYDRSDMVAELSASELMDMSSECTESISDVFSESFTFMKDNNLYNIGSDSSRMNVSYTTYIYGYDVPFLFVTTEDSVCDLQSVIHEFGHFYAFYGNPAADFSNLDVSEVHSQGLEVLSWEYYDEIYGDEAGQDVCLYMISLMLESVISGCMYDEFQQRIYESDDITLSEINKLYFDLCKEYGMEVYDTGDGEGYSWVDVTHNFIAPFYYVSYAVSAMVSLDIWNVQLENPEKAVNMYLDFVNNSASLTSLESILSAVGISSPFEEDSACELAENVASFVVECNEDIIAA